MGIANLLSSVDGTFTINTEDDTLKKFESNYPGLSAKVYKIEPKYSNFQDGGTLTLKTSHGTKKIIYKLKGNDLTFLGSAIGNYEVPGLKQLQQENAVVIAVVVHQCYTDMEEGLEAVVNHSQPEILWETCSANFYDFYKENASGVPTSYTRYTLQDYSCLAETRFIIKLNKSGY